ncbi:MAG: hypothetical protein GEU90_19075 [Gemmatimonas sp.]|nr:hypothetical protein [Gemmatimonas sp.]
MTESRSPRSLRRHARPELLAFAAVVLLVGYAAAKGVPTHDALSAARLCESLAASRLNVEGRVAFPVHEADSVQELASGVYRVRSRFESTGASETSFTNVHDCTIEFAEDGRWQLIDLHAPPSLVANQGR